MKEFLIIFFFIILIRLSCDVHKIAVKVAPQETNEIYPDSILLNGKRIR